MTHLTTQTITGSNLTTAMAAAAARWQAVHNPTVSPGACHCHGGTGNCIGCDAVPVRQTFRRTAALDGRAGLPGRPATTELGQGHIGIPGNATIVVNKGDGTQERYSSIYRLELVDFDMEDENGDSIFELGEHVFVRRITVKNTGELISQC